jgi:hypothetical protein
MGRPLLNATLANRLVVRRDHPPHTFRITRVSRTGAQRFISPTSPTSVFSLVDQGVADGEIDLHTPPLLRCDPTNSRSHPTNFVNHRDERGTNPLSLLHQQHGLLNAATIRETSCLPAPRDETAFRGRSLPPPVGRRLPCQKLRSSNPLPCPLPTLTEKTTRGARSRDRPPIPHTRASSNALYRPPTGRTDDESQGTSRPFSYHGGSASSVPR